MQSKSVARKFFITNTLSGKKEEFKPLAAPKVLFYSCGPTVYGPLHIGNARALITSDLFFRWLKHIGYDVNYVRNYTDVDDKIIHRALEEKISSLELANKYIDYCETDMKSLSLSEPTRKARVTETMPEIIALIEKIIANKHAYVVDGEVLFDIKSFEGYGKLSKKNIDDLQAGARVEVDEKKKNPFDFSLWKPAKPGEPFWESPWGRGRPGWHIECSAMASKWLADTIDLHHGGQDLIFPHHENEIAQSEAASHKPFCAHWVHNGFLNMGKEKMSKSLGNLLTIREFLEGYGAEILKFIYISHHYRSPVEFSDELILKTIEELERVYTVKKWAKTVVADKNSAIDANFDSLKGKASEAFTKIENELFSDLNSPGALGHFFTYIREINRAVSESKSKPSSGAAVAAEFLELVEVKLPALWNVFGEDADDMLALFNKRRGEIHLTKNKTQKSLTDEEIQQLIHERASARANKNFKRSDEIRQQFDQLGIVLIDAPTGTTWKYK